MACLISELLKNKEGWVPGITFFEKITSFTCLVGSGLNDIFQLKAQSHIFSKSLFSLEADALALFKTEKREVPSANNLTLEVRSRGRSLM